MSCHIRKPSTLSVETLERRDLLAVAQLVSDFDFSNFSSRNSPIGHYCVWRQYVSGCQAKRRIRC